MLGGTGSVVFRTALWRSPVGEPPARDYGHDMPLLNAIDATFLELEEADEAAHMHIGGVLEFEPSVGGPPTVEELREQLDERIDLLPRYRQRLSHQHTGGLEWPSWELDEAFHISRHVRHATLPAPGGEEELNEWAADFWSHRMDRTAPLWEVVLVDGLESGGWAMVTKTHHCMVDGVGSVDLAHLLLDVDRAGRPDTPWQAPPPMDRGRLGLPGWLSGPAHLTAAGLRAGVHAARHPREALHRSRVMGDLLVRSKLMAAPATSLNVPITGHRRFAVVDAELEDVRAIAHAADAKINDVVMAVVAGALRRLLLARGEQPPQRGLRAMVPVNVRSDAEHDGRLGNRISSMFIDLPVAEADPVARLDQTRRSSLRHKHGDQAVGSATLLSLTSLAPPVLHATIARTLYARRLFNVTVTNVPGPQVPLYAFGDRLLRIMPLVPLAADHCVGVAIMSYDGTLTFGLVGDFDGAADLGVLHDAVAEEIDALRAAVAMNAPVLSPVR